MTRTTATALAVAAATLAAIGGSAVARSGGTAPAAASVPAGSGALVVDWNRELLRIVRTPGAQPATVHPTRLARPVFTHWAGVTPFVLESAAQFRPAPPPDVSSPEYRDAIAEVRDLGRDSSTTRSADQTLAARFWSAPIWNYWNEIAQRTALSHHLGLVRTAHLFADLNLAFADGVIAFYDAKYHDRVWRPITAIRETDPGWPPLTATPADPSYPGAHSAVSAAAATVLSRYFGDHTAVMVTSELLPGVSRSFPGLEQAAVEAGVSRIYAGVHTRIDHEAGLRLGRRVAGSVLARATPG